MPSLGMFVSFDERHIRTRAPSCLNSSQLSFVRRPLRRRERRSFWEVWCSIGERDGPLEARNRSAQLAAESRSSGSGWIRASPRSPTGFRVLGREARVEAQHRQSCEERRVDLVGLDDQNLLE